MGKTGRENNSYSAEFKLKAVEQYLSGEIGGLTIAARQLGLRSKTQLSRWIKLYKQDPELLKQDNRGKTSSKDGVRKGRPKKVKLDEMSKDEQIEYLKMENAILKKARALRRNYGEH
ncbi:MAG: helix-turn-helix domain-containing protein [Erysipelotrichaceae bacterium]|jgi:transposase-like protein|nr:helix-turn-helix domain-containing protein [Erysipelotrichaceae bacterium]